MAGGQQYIEESIGVTSQSDLHVVASAPAGWYVVSADCRRWFDGRTWTDYYAPVLADGPERSGSQLAQHGFHLIMTIMTLGTWLPVWAGVTVAVGIRRLRALSRHDGPLATR